MCSPQAFKELVGLVDRPGKVSSVRGACFGWIGCSVIGSVAACSAAV